MSDTPEDGETTTPRRVESTSSRSQSNVKRSPTSAAQRAKIESPEKDPALELGPKIYPKPSTQNDSTKTDTTTTKGQTDESTENAHQPLSILDYLFDNPFPTSNEKVRDEFKDLFLIGDVDFDQNTYEHKQIEAAPPNKESQQPRKPLDLDNLICRLLSTGMPTQSLTKTVSTDDLYQLCDLARDVFMSQPMLIEIDPPIYICGDIHGQYADLLRIFDKLGFPPQSFYLFLGDYVDRGRHSIETVSLLLDRAFGSAEVGFVFRPLELAPATNLSANLILAYKVKFPKSFFLLRGNHETAPISSIYGFRNECCVRYEKGMHLFLKFHDTFNCMPAAALVAGKILCMHGGLSRELMHLDQIRTIQRPTPGTHPGLMHDLIWADPHRLPNIPWLPSTRKTSYTFSEEVIEAYCRRLNLDLIVRAHQLVDDGFQFFADRKLITVFSAPSYEKGKNKAAALFVDEDLSCRLEVFYHSDSGGSTTTHHDCAANAPITCEVSFEAPIVRKIREELLKDKQKKDDNLKEVGLK